MSVLAAFLSAVNVGGRKVAMADLREGCLAAGFKRAQTLLASGNVVLACGRKSVARVAQSVEAIVRETSGIETRAIPRDADALEAARARNPFTTHAPNRVLIWFLDGAPSKAQIAALVAHNGGHDRFEVHGEELFAAFGEGELPNSKLTPAVVKKHLGVIGTARNLNTVDRVIALARAMEAA